MKIARFSDKVLNNDKVEVVLILETAMSKELSISMKKALFMKEHKAPLPIIIHMLEGKVNFRVNDQNVTLSKSDVITIDGGVPHSLEALEDTIIRLSIMKLDTVNRVKDVVEE